MTTSPIPLDETDLRGRLEAAGWTVESTRADALRVQGRASAGVTTATAHRGEAFAFVASIARSEDGDVADAIHRRPLAACTRHGTAKLWVSVRDGASARELLVALAPIAATSTELALAAAVLGDRGWMIDSAVERDYDSFGWELKAHRDDEALEIDCNLLSHPRSPEVRQGHAVHPIGKVATLRATVHSLSMAQRLLAALTAP